MLTSTNREEAQSITTLSYDKNFLKFIDYIQKEIINISIKSTKKKDITEARWLQGGVQVLQELINEISEAKERCRKS